MSKLYVLIVENDEQDIQTYKDTIKTINDFDKNGFEITAIIKKTKEDGLKALELRNWDAALIDLKLSVGDILNAKEGNDIVKEIYKKRRFPIYILTNTPEDVDRGFEESIFLKVNSKDGIDYRDVFNEIIDIYKTGILNILGRKGAIETMLDDIFWKNISGTLKDWMEITDCEKPLLRYVITHLQEYLELSDDGGGFNTVLPIENYIKPSVKKYFFTGDVIHRKSCNLERYIILTPACDLSPHGKEGKPKTKNILLAEIQPFHSGVFGDKIRTAKKQSQSDKDNIQIEKAKEDIMKLISNNFSPKYYYLPDTLTIKGGLINFQQLLSIDIKTLDLEFEKDLSITNQFVKDIIAKFSSYYSRQGSPDFDFDSLVRKHLI